MEANYTLENINYEYQKTHEGIIVPVLSLKKKSQGQIKFVGLYSRPFSFDLIRTASNMYWLTEYAKKVPSKISEFDDSNIEFLSSILNLDLEELRQLRFLESTLEKDNSSYRNPAIVNINSHFDSSSNMLRY